MQRYSNQNRGKAPAPKADGAQQETFSQMASATASNSGVVGKLLVISLIIVSVAVTAFVGYMIVRGVDGDQSNLVQSDNYQAVFLSDGQIYFGNITNLDEEWMTLENIYYLQVNQQVQPDRSKKNEEAQQPQISLAKLGNELHGPQDSMYINRESVNFWENLKDARSDSNTEGSRVVEAISNYINGKRGDQN